MVIVLTGTQAINKKFLARILLASLNTFEYNGYTCDFTHADIKIYDSNKNLVYKLSTIEGGVINVESNTDNVDINDLSIDPVNIGEDDGVEDLLHTHPDVIEYFLKLNKEIFEDGIKHSHYVNTFESIDQEFGLTDTPKFVRYPETPLAHPHTFDDVLNNIKNSTLDVKVITGTFGNGFLDMIKAALPDEEFHIVSIIRNPSVSWLMNKKPDSKWLTDVNPHLTEFVDYERFYSSLINAIKINTRDDINVVRFEDIIASGKLTISPSIEIDLRSDYHAYNQWLSQYEGDIDILMSDEEFAPFNEKMLNYTFADFYNSTDDTDEESEYGVSRAELVDKISANFPMNIFKDLGYEPLTKAEILKK